MVLCLRECLGAMASFTTESTQTGLSEGADRIGGQLRGGKECHFSGVTRSGRVWSKVPESDAGRVRYGNGWRKAVVVDQSVLGRSLWHSVQAVTDRPLPVSQVGRKLTRGLQ